MIKTIESKRYGTIEFLIDELDVPILDKFKIRKGTRYKNVIPKLKGLLND